VIADAYPNQPFPARINFIAPSIDPQRGTVEVRLAVDPAPEFLRQDMTVSVNVETARRERTITIPNDALSTVQGEQAQVLLLDDGKLQRRQITLGLRGLALSEVLGGLRDGDKVLADGSSTLTEGTRVRLILRSNQPSSNQPSSNQPSSNIDGSGSRNEIPVKFN
jgi:HlyD family secretion protein